MQKIFDKIHKLLTSIKLKLPIILGTFPRSVYPKIGTVSTDLGSSLVKNIYLLDNAEVGGTFSALFM